jgi:hypothetical protein
MGRFRHLVLALIVGPVVVALVPPAVLAQESKKDIIEELQGKWRRMSSEDNGKPAEKDEDAIRYSFQGKSLTVTRGKDFEQRGDWKIVEVGKKSFKVDYTITEELCERDPRFGSAFYRQAANVLASRLDDTRQRLSHHLRGRSLPGHPAQGSD